MQSKVYTPTVKVPVNFHARPSESSQVQFAHSLSGSSFQPTLQAPEMNCNDNMVSQLKSVNLNQAKPFVPSHTCTGMQPGASAPVNRSSVPFPPTAVPLLASPSKANPFQCMNLHHAQGFVPCSGHAHQHQQVLLSPIKTCQQLSPGLGPQFEGQQMEQGQQPQGSSKSFVERSMYKREMCKNWTDVGFCRYGSKCQYAHGIEELSENNPLYLNE